MMMRTVFSLDVAPVVAPLVATTDSSLPDLARYLGLREM